jgi:hypothetical protein
MSVFRFGRSGWDGFSRQAVVNLPGSSLSSKRTQGERRMLDPGFWSIEHAAGLFLILGTIALFPGVMMFWMRAGHRGGAPRSHTHFVWERSFVMAAVVLTAIGFVLLEGPLQNTAGRILARTGATAYLFGGILGVAAEALDLTRKEQSYYPLVVIYVVLAFLGQAAIGGALLQAGLLAAWIGWATIVWNLAWLVVLPLITPRDIHFPVLHHFMPLVIGIALLWQVP